MSGFVYIWYDRKHKRYYVGSHWGPEDDGYICSSFWMKRSKKNRPEDFKRRVLTRNIQSRELMLLEEQRWIDMMKDDELKGVRYYNLRKKVGHWHGDEEKAKTIRERISIATKAAMNTPEGKKANHEGMLRRNKAWTEERRERQRATMIATMRKKWGEKPQKPKFGSEEYRTRMSESISKFWEKRPRNPITVKGLTFSSAKEAAAYFGVTVGAIYQWRRKEMA